MGIVPRPIPPPLKTLREGEIPTRNINVNQGIQMGYQPRSRRRVWNEYDCVAARISAPIWLFVWIMTVGKMGKGLWYWKEINRSQGLPPGVADAKLGREISVANAKAEFFAGQTYIRDGAHVLVGERRPLADDADMRPNGRQLRAAEKAAKHLDKWEGFGPNR